MAKAKTVTVKATGPVKKINPTKEHLKKVEKLIERYNSPTWDIGNRIDSIAMKIGCLAGSAKLIAEACEDPYSSAAWALADSLERFDMELYEIGQELCKASA